MASTPEGRVKQAVAKRLASMGIYYFMPMQNGFGRVGIPDFVCCWDGKFLAIETKAPGKRGNTSANQDRELAAIKRAYGLAVVIDDVNQLDEVLV